MEEVEWVYLTKDLDKSIWSECERVSNGGTTYLKHDVEGRANEALQCFIYNGRHRFWTDFRIS